MMNANLSRDMTAANLSSFLAPVKATGGVRVSFSYRRVTVRSKDPTKNGMVENRLCISKNPLGDPKTVSVGYITEQDAARRHPQEWALFTQTETMPSHGTPLSELPGLSRSQISLLQINGLECIEDLLEISADAAIQIGMEASRARKIAVGWKAKADENADITKAADVESALMAQLRAMQMQMDAMQKAMAERDAENAALRRLSGEAASVPDSGMIREVVNRESFGLDVSDNDGFLGGGDVVTGSDDLGDDADPLSD